VTTAWAAASSFRGTDLRGGANGARIRLEPQRGWEVNAGVGPVLEQLEQVRQQFNSGPGTISLADLIVLAGCAGVEKAARDAGHEVTVPFTPGRTDATQEQTDVESFAVMEPVADGFRNWARADDKVPAEVRLLDKAYLLTLTAPEMTVLLGGLRALGVSRDRHGVLTDRPGALTNDFFVTLLTPGTEWSASADTENVFGTADGRWTATAVDLVFGSHSQLRSLAEVYASSDATEKFVGDFVAAWDKVMNLDRFDLRK
jgi:catalase-peroxidase